MPRILFSTIAQKLLQFFYVQLFVTLIALPILLSWGLPISSMTIIGNFLFAPFLTVFLFLSTLLFFTELLHLPNSPVVYAIETFCSWWSWCIHCGSPSWLITFVQPHYLVLLFIPCVALIIVHAKYLTRAQQVAALTVLALITGTYLFFLCPPTSHCTTLACNKGAIFVIHHHKQTVVIDPGFITQSGNASSWLEHTLLKELAKQLGSTTIHHLILLQPSSRLFEAVAKMCKLASVEKIYLPRWHGTLSHNQWRHFFAMKHTVEDANGMLISISTPMIISLDQGAYLSITPQEKNIRAGSLKYPALYVQGCFGTQKIKTASIKAFAK